MNPEAPIVNDLQPGRAQAARPARELARWAGAGLLGFLLTAAAILWCRRLAGAFSAPLEPAALLVASTLIAAVVAASRMAWRYGAAHLGPGLRFRLAPGVLTTAAAAIGAALSLPGTPVRGLVILWAILAAEECWAWGPAAWSRLARRPAPGRARPRTAQREQAGGADPAESVEIVSAPRFDHPSEGQIVQQMTRSRTAGGSEVLSGWLRVSMAAGQRSANVHVAFCPSFARTPRVSVEQRGGPRARIRTAQVLRQGARFDLKLAVPGETAQTVLLEFSAEAAPATPGPEPSAPDRESSPDT